MKMSNETTQGWIGSLILHALLFLLLLFLTVPEIILQDEFIELSWGALAAVTSQPAPQPPSKPVEPQVVAAATQKPTAPKMSSQLIVLPERRIPDPSPEVLRMPQAEKMETADRSAGNQKNPAVGTGDRDALSGRNLGERESRGTSDARSPIAADVSSIGAGSVVGDVDSGQLLSIQWKEGGTRRKISGDLPKYPSGVNVEAQVKILATVIPDGSVKFVQPAQKANTRLEDVAMAEIRYWRFEPLKSSLPQVDQICEITFLFRLR